MKAFFTQSIWMLLLASFTLNSYAQSGDNCSTVINLTSLSSPQTYSTCGLTANDISPAPSCISSNGSMIFRIDVPSGRYLRIRANYVSFLSFGTSLRVGGGCPGSTQLSCTTFANNQNAYYANTSGSTQSAYFVVWNIFSSCSSIIIDWEISAPVGDDCTEAIDLNALSSPQTYYTCGNAGSDIAGTCIPNASRSMIFTINVPAGQQLNIRKPSDDFNSSHSLRIGGTCPGTTQMTCSSVDTDWSSYNNTSGVTQTAYYIVWGDAVSDCGVFNLEWHFSTPGGDNCANIVTFTGTSGAYTGSLVGLNNNNYMSCAVTADFIAQISVPDGHRLRVFTPVVFSGEQLELRSGGACPGTTNIVGCYGSLNSTDLQYYDNSTGAAQTIYVLVGGSQNGPFQLNWEIDPLTSVPAGDDCSNAIDLDLLTSPITVDNTDMVGNISGHCHASSFKTQTYRDFVANITVPDGYRLQIRVLDNNIPGTSDPDVTLRWGGACPGTNEAVCFVDAPFVTHTFDNTTGASQEAYFVVAPWQSRQFGESELSWELFPIPASPPANDDCAGAIDLTNPGSTESVANQNIYDATDDVLTCSPTNPNGGNGVWYKVIGNGCVMTASTSNFPYTNYDTEITLYTGTCGTLTCLDYNDENDVPIHTTNGTMDVGTNTESGGGSAVQWMSVAGQEYFIFVGESPNSFRPLGDLQITLSSACPMFGDSDNDGINDFVDLDDDNDGIPDLLEGDGYDPLADDDMDGILNYQDMDIPGFLDANSDGINDNFDTDGDGILDSVDLDSDNDGIPDVVEAGGADSDGDGRIDGFSDNDMDGLSDNVDADDNNPDSSASGNGLGEPDADGDGIPNYQDLDADNDGIPDVVEVGGVDANGDGLLDNYVDTDGDGFADTVDGDVGNDGTAENTAGALVPTGADTNNDGQPDTTPTYSTANSDGDNLFNFLDIDSDNDGITDIIEAGGTDADGDGRVDSYTDTDGDGFHDPVDGDVGNDGTAENTAGALLPTGADANNDGHPDTYPNANPDGDNLPNPYDLDSDDDGIADIVEAGGVDTNGDGRIDGSQTADNDGDGLLDTYDPNDGGDAIANLDTDGDGIPNALDLDADNDGIQDVLEAGGTDANNDGRIDNYTDSDNDGFSDNVDGDVGNDGTAENTAGALIVTGTDTDSDGIPNSYPDANADGTGFPNPYDLDSDDDGILDTREGNVPDANNDGIADGTDGDGNGWSGTIDGNEGGTALNLPNTDGDSQPDYLDIDADNDGIVDNVEAQTTAGYTPPTGNDTDGDGIDDAYDNDDASFGGNSNNGITPTNTDGTDNPDYLDLDSDNDGLSDRLEGWDTNGNGIIDGSEMAYVGTTDSDGDGLLDEYEAIDNTTTPGVTNTTNNNTTPSSHPDVTNPGNNRDWREAVTADFGNLDPGTWSPAYATIPTAGTQVWAGLNAPDTEMSTDLNDEADGLSIGTGTLVIGQPNNVQITLNTNTGNTDMYYGIWFDWNNDGVFDDFFSGMATSPPASPFPVDVVLSVTPPLSVAGNPVNAGDLYAIRLVVSANVVSNQPGSFQNGEVEDYNSPVPLPIELLTFTTNTVKCELMLYWETATTQNLGYFDIEASKDGRNFVPVAQQKPIASNSWVKNSYKFAIPDQYQDHYFRLKAVDLDGTFEYSKILFADTPCKNPYQIRVYPNPNTTQKLTVEINSNQVKDQVSFIIYDALGRQLFTQKSSIQMGINKVVLNTQELSNGVYYIKIIGMEQFAKPVQFIRNKF